MGDFPSGIPRAPAPALAPRSCGSLLVVLQTPHFVLRVDIPCTLVVAQRTETPFERLSDLDACFERIEEAFSGLVRSRYRLLVDARRGPSRNDPAFEASFAMHRGKLLFGFGKTSVLGATAAGRLQIQRYAKADGQDVGVTTTPAEAFTYLEVDPHAL
jgi:hypothetical protein